MANATWSNETLAFKADSEGLDYLILHYLPVDAGFEDPELGELIAKAREALRGIERKLEPFMP